MNLMHLKYIIEVARAGSISKAANKLYMNQPRLSKIIKEFEEHMHIKIFERTSKGVVPTKKGAEFIERAKKIIMQVDEMEALYCNYDEKSLHLDVCVPRASYIADAFCEYLSKINIKDKKITVNYRETNTFDTIKMVYEGDANIGIIRFFDNEKKYFTNLLKSKELESKELYKFNYQLLVSNQNPLVFKDQVCLKDLEHQVAISHGDVSLPASFTNEHPSQKEILIYERAIQLELLSTLPHCYMWVSPMPGDVLQRYNLTTLKINDHQSICHDWLIVRQEYRLSKEDKSFINEIKRLLP